MTSTLKTLALAIAAAAGIGGAAAACPNYGNAAAESYRATGQQLYAAPNFSVTAGGNYNIQNCANVRPQTDRGRGFFTAAPDFSFDLSGMQGYRLEIRTISRCDSALLINTGAANWYYDDDDNGNLDAKIVLTRPSNGRIDVWVGTQDGAYCDAVLTMETFNN